MLGLSDENSVPQKVQSGEVLGDFGLGSPNLLPPFLVLLRIVFEVLNCFVRRHGYAPSNGLAQTRKAFADRILKLFGYQLDPETQITMTEGSRESIPYILAQYSGLIVLPSPYYPGHYKPASEAKGCKVEMLEMSTVRSYLDRLERLLKSGVKVSLVFASFDNPVWLPRTIEDYIRLVDLANKYGFDIISDEAYGELGYYTDPVSIMQVPGWMDVAYVLHTASKNYCMAGWKDGFVIARADRIPSIAAKKADKSEGGNLPGQLSLTTAYKYCSGYPRQKVARVYRERAELTYKLLCDIGFSGTKPAGGMFVWMHLPPHVESDDFVARLNDYGYIVYDGAKYGKPGYIRWCLREGKGKTRHACRAVRQVLEEI